MVWTTLGACPFQGSIGRCMKFTAGRSTRETCLRCCYHNVLMFVRFGWFKSVYLQRQWTQPWLPDRWLELHQVKEQWNQLLVQLMSWQSFPRLKCPKTCQICTLSLVICTAFFPKMEAIEASNPAQIKIKVWSVMKSLKGCQHSLNFIWAWVQSNSILSQDIHHQDQRRTPPWEALQFGKKNFQIGEHSSQFGPWSNDLLWAANGMRNQVRCDPTAYLSKVVLSLPT